MCTSDLLTHEQTHPQPRPPHVVITRHRVGNRIFNALRILPVCVCVCLFVCVRDSEEEILIEFMQLIYDMCFCGCGWESVSGIESVFMRVCVWGSVSEGIYACVCVWIVLRNSFGVNSHAQRQRKLRGISGSISIKLQRCNTASVSRHNVITYSSKSSGKWKTFYNFHIISIFKAKRDALAPCTGLECHEN